MKKVYKTYALKGIIYFIIIFSIMHLGLIGTAVSEWISNIDQTNIVAYSILISFHLCFFGFLMFGLNRCGCKVIYDSEKQVIMRKGFICGYKYKIKVDDIKEIISIPFPWETTYYVIVDSINTAPKKKSYESYFKTSFIRFEKTAKNAEIIKKFWDGPIKEYKTYEELYKE